ncbi:MAG: NAD(P)/FAD-dependent oxidoreductase [Candidatus Eisenbacteria bacterium]
MTRERFDIIVAGCGPAGASCAGRAAELGLSVLVLEMTVFPRSKPCAAGLTQGALKLLGADAELVAHDTASRLRIDAGRTCLLWTGESPLVRTTTRRELDSLLARRAAEAGATVEFGVRLNSARLADDGVTVEAGGRTLSGRYLVGADGPRSAVARVAGLPDPVLCGAAYVRAYPPSGAELDRYAGTVTFDPTAAERGYGWVFPKRDHLNVGVFSQLPFGKRLLRDLYAYVASLGLDEWNRRGPFAAPIPLGARREPSRGRFILAGDAAGLADPLTGEGISHAMASGRAAAEAVAQSLAERSEASPLYNARVRSEIVRELRARSRVGNALYSLGPRGIARAAGLPPARFVIRRLGLWDRPGNGGGSLIVESAQGRCHQ